MAFEVVLPQLGLSMDSGQIMAWLKQPGEYVEPGDLLLEIEGDKSVVEVEAVENGYLQVVKGPDDGAIPVGEVIAYLLAEGEDEIPIDGITPASEPVVNDGQDEVADSAPATTVTNISLIGDRPPSSPAARRRAGELGVDWRQAIGTGSGGRIKERDVVALAQSGFAVSSEDEMAKEAMFTPVARRLAETAGLEIDRLVRRYPGKRIERSDVEVAIREAVQGHQASPYPTTTQGLETVEPRREPVTGLRRLIADRMAHSAHSTAAVTLTTEADATELARIRQEKKADPQSDVIPSYNTLLVKLVAKALLEHPAMNATFDEDTIVTWQHINIGVAVDTERGLVVPVVRDVPGKTVEQLSREMNELLTRTKDGKAMPDELSGGTFTVTNLGAYEIDAFTPIINLPECAVLGVGRLVDRYVVIDREPIIRTMVALSLTFDHRLVDGAPAAIFLQRIKHLIERPYLWLV